MATIKNISGVNIPTTGPEVTTTTAEDLKAQLSVADEAAQKVATAAPAQVQASAQNIVAATEAEISIEDLSEDDILRSASIQAKPLSMVTSLDIKVKRKEYYYRWINRFSQGAQRYGQAKAMGYVNATIEDVEVSETALQDGCIIVGDLILMKMPKAEAYGAMKANMEKAIRATSKAELRKKGESFGNEAMASTKAPADFLRSKVSIYHPEI